MKSISYSTWTLAICAVTALTTGCAQNQALAPQNVTEAITAATAPTAAETTAAVQPQVSAAATNVVAQVQAATNIVAQAQTATNVVAQAQTATNAVANVQTLIDTAKTLIGENKFTDALKTLTDLSNLKLTDAQQTVVNGLKDQLNKALASKATTETQKAVEGLLPK
ncbi:MAG: hypothetical protein M1608_04645 [Candidatus Omnitrophica bacterium]|nr:hypothetical protein [Candidatus Omnitrophota bacterium]